MRMQLLLVTEAINNLEAEGKDSKHAERVEFKPGKIVKLYWESWNSIGRKETIE